MILERLLRSNFVEKRPADAQEIARLFDSAAHYVTLRCG